MEPAPIDVWSDDILDRKRVADFLYARLKSDHEAMLARGEATALCISLDADWGAGKTFFVQRWARDLKTRGHAVIQFDAWVNDLSDDPLVGFLAQFKKGLEAIASKASLKDAIASEIKLKVSEVVKQAGRAAVPTLVAVGKAVVKKGTGVEWDDVSEAGSAGLEKFIGAAMKAHVARRTAIDELKVRIASLMESLRQHESFEAPVFVLIDELDRCRPDYAIRLLEGIKHLFDAPGLCFVVSTNIRQLAASVSAVYGEQFDSRRYLHRFFRFDFALPKPDFEAYARRLATGSKFAGRKFVPATLPKGDPPQNVLDGVAHDFAFVASSFGLDLRSQEQVFRRAEASASAIPPNVPIHTFFIFFLTAVLHRSEHVFEDLQNRHLRKAALSSLRLEERSVHHVWYYQGNARAEVVSGNEIAAQYLRLLEDTDSELLAEISGQTSVESFADHLRRSMVMGRAVTGGLTIVSRYPSLVRMAGYMDFVGENVK